MMVRVPGSVPRKSALRAVSAGETDPIDDPSDDALAAILRGKAIGLGYLMAYMTNHYLGPVYKAVEARFGLTSPEFLSLMCIVSAPDIKAIDISRASGRPRNSISRAISLLLEKGLIEVEANTEDRRSKRLTATGAGFDLYRQIEPLFAARHEAMLRVLTASERQMLLQLLNKLAFRADGWARPY
jgi:MarR family transcriptional regulator, temperature-dependent positive regulator of motility